MDMVEMIMDKHVLGVSDCVERESLLFPKRYTVIPDRDGKEIDIRACRG